MVNEMYPDLEALMKVVGTDRNVLLEDLLQVGPHLTYDELASISDCRPGEPTVDLDSDHLFLEVETRKGFRSGRLEETIRVVRLFEDHPGGGGQQISYWAAEISEGKEERYFLLEPGTSLIITPFYNHPVMPEPMGAGVIVPNFDGSPFELE